MDVHYPETGGACAALVVANDRQFTTLTGEHTVRLERAAPYQPGRFFVRELPAISAVLEQTEMVDVLIIDGYVDLDPAGRPGLGAHLRARYGIPVIGVAKTAFRTATHAIAVRRGQATRPLFVTAGGMPLDQAVVLVIQMSGPHRLPDALRRVDSLARHGFDPGSADTAEPVDPAEPVDLSESAESADSAMTYSGDHDQ